MTDTNHITSTAVEALQRLVDAFDKGRAGPLQFSAEGYVGSLVETARGALAALAAPTAESVRAALAAKNAAETRELHAAQEADELRAALLDCARKAEALKRPCGTDPESPQAVRNAEYQSISTTAHIALGTIRGAAPTAEPPKSVMVEAVAEVAADGDGMLQLVWLVEGGVASLAEGVVLVMPHSPITGDDGSGEVYTTPQSAPTAEPAPTEAMLRAGQEALFDDAPDLTHAERESVAREIWIAMCDAAKGRP